MAQINDWELWRMNCALDLCPADVRERLRGFAWARFARYARACARDTNSHVNALIPDARAAFHLFETHTRLNATRAGKSYKEWLFARAQNGASGYLDVIQGGASVLLRSVVREYVRREFSAEFMQSLDQSPAGGNTPSLSELLPAPDAQGAAFEHRELERLAQTATPAILAQLTRRERIAILARELGLALAEPVVLRTAECRKSVLHSAYHQALRKVADHVRAAFASESRQTLIELAALGWAETKTAILAWGRSESALSHLFNMAEGNQHHVGISVKADEQLAPAPAVGAMVAGVEPG